MTFDVWDNDGGKPEFKPEYPSKLMKDLPVSAKRGAKYNNY